MNPDEISVLLKYLPFRDWNQLKQVFPNIQFGNFHEAFQIQMALLRKKRHIHNLLRVFQTGTIAHIYALRRRKQQLRQR